MTTKTGKSSGSMIKITLISGLANKMETQRKVVRALGLGKHGSSIVHADTPTIQGMVRKVAHLVCVEPTSEQPKTPKHKQSKK